MAAGQRFRHQWRVGNDPIRFQAAARREQNLWLGIINAHGQLAASEAPENHGVDGPQARASQHGNKRFGNHGHVDHNPIPDPNPQVPKAAGGSRHPLRQGCEAEVRFLPRHRGVVNQGRAVAVARYQVRVKAQPGRVEPAIREPRRDPLWERLRACVGAVCQARRLASPNQKASGVSCAAA